MLISEYKKLHNVELTTRSQATRANDKKELDKITFLLKNEQYKIRFTEFLEAIYNLSFIGKHGNIIYSIEQLFKDKMSSVSKNMFIQDLANLIYIPNEKPVMSKYSYLRYEKVEETPKEFLLELNPNTKPLHVTDEIFILINKIGVEQLHIILKLLDCIIPTEE